MQIARQQVRAVGLDHQPVGRNRAHQGHEMRAATLVVDPTRDADRESEIEARRELCSGARETVGYGARGERGRMLAQNRDEVLMRIALMEEHGLADTRRDFELASECGALRIARREVAEVIEP